MGILARLAAILWRRWADYNSVVALLDLLDLKTAAGVGFAWLAMIFVGATNTSWSPQGVIVAAFVVAACVAVVIVVGRILLWPAAKPEKPQVASTSLSATPEADIGASDAYFMVLADSLWKHQQQATMIVTGNTRPDWLSFRLRDQVHNALRNGKIAAWGRECLTGMVTTAEQPIPPDVWNKAELDFNSDPRFPRTPACLKGNVTWQLGRSVWNDVRFFREQFFRQFPLVSVDSQREVAQQLASLYAMGVAERNRLMPTIAEFDLDKEKMILSHWDNRVLALLDSEFVKVAEKSAFRTLNLFQPISANAPNKTAEQRHVEAIWTEKLNRLKPIIDRVGK
jgi:hypothetical protein